MLDAIGRSTAASIISMEDHSALRASTAFTAELTEITVTQKVPVLRHGKSIEYFNSSTKVEKLFCKEQPTLPA